MTDRCSVLFGTDLHGDRQCPEAADAFVERAAEFHARKDLVVIGGDVWDFRPLRAGASNEEKRESLQKDFELGYSFLVKVKPDVVLLGNHDARLWEMAELRSGPVSDYARELVGRYRALARSLGTRTLPYHKSRGVFKHRRVSYVHGYFHGETAVRSHARTYGNCVFGHVHAFESVTLPTHDRATAHSVGSLCLTDMDYNARLPGSLRQENGWAEIHHVGRDHVVLPVRRMGKQFVTFEMKAAA